MKKILYLCVCILILAAKAHGQYHLTTATWEPYTDTSYVCSSPTIIVNTDAYTSGLTVKTYFGNGTSTTSIVYNSGTYGTANVSSNLSSPGTYTLKHVLYNGTSAIDSIVLKNEFLYCNTMIIKCYDDLLGTGVYDSASDKLITMPLKLQVSKNGTVVDTQIISSGIYFPIFGYVGDIFSFKIISLPPSLVISSPISGIIYDTVNSISNSYVSKYFGFQCTGSTVLDVAINPIVPITGIHRQLGNIYVTNSSCNPTNATVSLYYSSRYIFAEAIPAPTSIVGDLVTWNLTGVSAINPTLISYRLWMNSTIADQDTVHSHFNSPLLTGDSDPSNNDVIVLDTALASNDPNEMSVSPSGYITNLLSSPPLKYTIGFENTGNDTAFNISVYDTLSDYVDPKSLKLIMASSAMNIAILQESGHNVVKFDFPNINLLDSSHHGQCDGAVIFTLNPKSGLPDGTAIYNHAGIFFDYNPVVMTNDVEDVVCNLCGDAVKNINKPKVNIYPNPATDELMLQMDNGAFNTLNITNTIGQTLITQPINSAQTTVNVAALSPGIYYITLRGENGIKTDKFVKE